MATMNETMATLERYPAHEFSHAALDELMQLDLGDAGLLSVYLDIDPATAQREGFEATLLDLWKSVRAEVGAGAETQRLEEEIARVNAYVRGWPQPPGRSVAMFSCAPRGVFAAIALPVPVGGGARFGSRAHVLPLIAALDEHEPYRVALIDRERARILGVRLGRIEERIEFEDPLPGRVTRGGGWAAGAPAGGGTPGTRSGQGIAHSSQGGYARHIDALVHRHIERVIAEIWRLARRAGPARIIIGGPPEAVTMLRQMLPPSLAADVVGTFPGQFYASDADVIERVERIEEQAERAHEVEVVDRAIERALKGEQAVLGWDDTLTALAEGRAHEVVLIEGDRRTGYACPAGHLAVVERITRCPYCGESMAEMDDLASWAVARAFATDARIEFVRGEAAEKLRVHGAAATSRY